MPSLLPAFGGQGLATLEATPTWSSTTPFSPITGSSCTLLVASCHAAFLEEINTLSAEDQKLLGICIHDFTDRSSVIWPLEKPYKTHPVLAGTVLLLHQALRFLAYIDDVSHCKPSSTAIQEALKCQSINKTGILSFSSGILTACVVASSPSVPSFIVNCVEAYRLAFWIGVRSKLHQVSSSTSSGFDISSAWGFVLQGMTKVDAVCAIQAYHSLHGVTEARLTLTAVMNNDLLTVSGHPEDLDSFSRTLPLGVTACSTNIYALYHCSARLKPVRNQVLDDIISRAIRFPKWTDLFVPLRSSFTGDLLDDANGNSGSGASLAQVAVDMILLHPVNWDVVIEKTLQSLPPGSDIEFLNIGLGSTLTKRLQATLADRGHSLKTIDLREHAHLQGNTKQEAIAIVGMAVHMPGAPSVDDLWSLLHNGMNTSCEIPQDRFDYKLYTKGEIPGRSMNAQKANFIDSPGVFDHKFFNISPREAKSMDPQQRLLLHVGYHALENAGYVPDGSSTFNPETMGCFIGCATHDYVQNIREDVDLYYSTGTLAAFLSGRLSYFLGLGGPSIVVDTACSSSLVAIHQACRSLMNKDCHAALAGGVNIISSPDMFLGLDKGHFLSPSGRCKTFDAAADGYSRGEGCGVFVLKRLEDAVAENDQVLGVIRGVEINQSGKAHSITHPHGPTQRSLFERLLQRSNVDPNCVTVVEAHGTGTQAGDTTELASIRATFNSNRPPNNPLYVTSVKGNIGHLEAASGSASLAKVLLMFQHRIIPRQVSFETLNPLFPPLESDNTLIATNNVAWNPAGEGKPRIAMINNFGAAGSNAALLVEEFVPKPHTNGSEFSEANRCFVVGISAKDIIALGKLRSNLIQWLKAPQKDDESIADIAYTLTARRQLFPHRIAVSASSKGDLVQKLQSVPISDSPATKKSVVLVFSGQGCQYRGMGSALYHSSHVFRRHIDECDGILVRLGFSGIKSVIVDGEPKAAASAASSREDFQSALFALQYALLKVWQSWGIKPVAVVGHSLGEYAALVAAEVITLRDALLLISTRAKLMEERIPRGTSGMVAIAASAKEVESMIGSKAGFVGLTISCFNSPTNCVVSGRMTQLLELQRDVERENGWKTSLLDFPFAAHSPFMNSLFEDLVRLSKTIRTSVPKLPVVSTVFGRLVHAGDPAFPPLDYFARQCVHPVCLTQSVDSFLSNSTVPDDVIWLEVGPHPTITPMLRSFPALTKSTFLPSLRKGQEPSAALAASLASLYCAGCPIDWRRVFSDAGPVKLIQPPSYPLSGPNFWVPFVEPTRAPRELPSIKHSFIGSWVQIPSVENYRVAIFETPIDRLKEYIQGHVVGQVPLCPASVYLEMIYSGITLAIQRCPTNLDFEGLDLQDIDFCKALVWNPKDATVLITVVDLLSCSYILKSRTPVSQEETIHVTGKYGYQTRDEHQDELSLGLTPKVLCLEALLRPAPGNMPETFSTRTIYQVIFPRVVEYSVKFHSLQSLVMPPNDTQASATFTIPINTEEGLFSVHPVFLDTLLHVAGFIANLQGGPNDAYICNEIQSVTVFPEDFSNSSKVFDIYCKLEKVSDSSDQGYVAESYAYVPAVEGRNPVVVARMAGIRFQRVRLSGLKAGLASLAGQAPFHLKDCGGDALDVASSSWITLQGIISRSCEVDLQDICLDLSLEHLGIDSLMRHELASNISSAYHHIGYRHQEIALCKTTTDLLNLVSPTTIPRTPSSCSLDRDNSPRTPDTMVTPQTHSRTLVNRPDTSSPLRRTLSDILSIREDTIRGDEELHSLGLDSLASIEATQTLQRKYRLQIPKGLFSPERTVRDVERDLSLLSPPVLHCDAGLNPFDRMCREMTFRSSLTLLQNSNSKLPPLVLIHDGSGLTASYERLLPLNRRVWAISNPHFSTSTKWASLPDMAKAYAKFIREEIEGHIILGGWSFGGVAAVEIAAHLPARSITVDGIVLIDAPNPSSHVPLSPSIFSHVLDSVEGLDRDCKKLCKEQFKMNGELLRNYRPERMEGLNHPRLVFLRSVEPYRHLEQENVPSWLSDRSNLDAISSGWNTVSTGRLIRALDIPGHHFSPFERQNVIAVTKKIQEACSLLEATE